MTIPVSVSLDTSFTDPVPEQSAETIQNKYDVSGGATVTHLLQNVSQDGISDQDIDLSLLLSEDQDDGWKEIQKQLLKSSPAFFAQEVLRGPPEAPYYGKFLISEHHQEWDSLILNYKRLCILAPRDHGKCQVGDALILSASGKRVRIDEWQGGYLWAYNSENHEFVQTYSPAARTNGVKKVLRVRTKTGREVVVTENHPLKLLDDWCRADELEVGQRIGVPYKSPVQGQGAIKDAWLVGLLVGDGGLTNANVVLSTGDPDVLDHVKSHEIKVRHAGGCCYRLLGMQPRMRELGLMGKTSHTKRVPEQIFEADQPSVAQFLSGYLDADASVSFHGGGSVEFYSVSEDLLRDVQHLLTRLGVLSVLSLKRGTYKKQPHYSWRLTVRGKDIITLAEFLQPKGSRSDQLKRLAKAQLEKNLCSGPAIDRYPKEVWDWVEHSEDWFRKKQLPRPCKQYEPTRDKLRRVAEAEDNLRIQKLVASDVLWDEIVDIEDMGEEETWSLYVPEFANYLANDIINHNTFFFDFAYPLWMSVTRPGTTGFIFSKTQEQASRILGDIKDEIEQNPMLKHLVPMRKSGVQWSSTSIRLTNGSRIYARGFGTSVRGAHPHWIIVDDGLNDETAYSEMRRKKEIDYFYNAISNMLVPNGQLIVVGTPFHQQDLYGDLEQNSEYEFRKYQAIIQGSDGAEYPLWPERYNLERLQAKRREIGNVRFAREFQCDPISDDMSLFPLFLFQAAPQEQRQLKLGMSLKFWQDLNIGIYIGVDFGLSASVQADYTVIWVMGVDGFGNRYIIDIFRDKGLPYQSQLSKINEYGRKYDPNLIFVEANQAQRIFGDELIRTTDLPIKKYTTGAEKNTLEKGIPALRVLLENTKFRIPRGDLNSVELTNTWISEMRSMTFVDGKITSTGEHDDTVMACYLCDQAIKTGGFVSYFDDDQEDLSGNMDDMLNDLYGLGDDEDDGISDKGGNGQPQPQPQPESKPSASGNLIDMDDERSFGGLTLETVLQHHGIF